MSVQEHADVTEESAIPIGTEPLEQERDSLNATLSPAEEQKLDREIRSLYERLLPSADSEAKRALVVNKLQTILSTAFPELSVKVAVFGSSGNLLFTSRSDGMRRAWFCRGIQLMQPS